jgi:hypothetical protein
MAQAAVQLLFVMSAKLKYDGGQYFITTKPSVHRLTVS